MPLVIEVPGLRGRNLEMGPDGRVAKGNSVALVGYASSRLGWAACIEPQGRGPARSVRGMRSSH